MDDDLRSTIEENQRLREECARDYAEMRRFQDLYIEAERRLSEIQALVNEQAEDEALWFAPVHISEDFLQRALRRLHAVIEDPSYKNAMESPDPRKG